MRENKATQTQRLAPLHEEVQQIRLKGYLNSKIQIHGKVATIRKRHFGLYKDLVPIVGGVRDFKGWVPLYVIAVVF